MIPIVLQVALAAGAAPSQLAFHSPSPLFALEIPDVRAVLDAYERAPLVQMLRDESVRGTVEKLEQALGADLGASFDAALGELGLPAGEGPRGIETLLAHVRRAHAISVSFAIRESAPGELLEALGRIARTQQSLLDLSESIDAFDAQHSRLPASLTELALPDDRLRDAWSRPFTYTPGEGGEFVLLSLGADGTVGGTGAATDVSADLDQSEWLKSERARRWNVLAVAELESEAAARDAIALAHAGLRSELDPTANPTTWRGAAAELRRFEAKEPTEALGWSLQCGTLVVLGLGNVAVEDVLARVEGRVPNLSSATEVRSLARYELANNGPVVARGFVSPHQLSDLASEFPLPLASSASPLALLESTGSNAAWCMTLAGERFVTDIAISAGTSGGWLSTFVSGPVPREALDFVPGDAAGVLAARIDGAKLFAQFSESLGISGSADDLRAMEEQHGFELNRDVFSNLTGAATIHLMPISTIGVPNVVASFEIRDPAAFENGMRGLAAVVEAQAGDSVRVKASKYRGSPTWMFKPVEEAPSPVSVSPTVAIVGKRVVVALTTMFANREIKRALGEEANTQHAIASSTSIPADAAILGSMDWGGMFASVYKAARGALALAGSAIELPIDVASLSAALPETAEPFTRFFQPTVFWGKPTDAGFHVHWEASFGPETWLGAVALGMAILQEAERAAEAVVPPEDVPEPSSSELDSTHAALTLVASRLAVFHIDQNRFPAHLDELTKPTPNYPNGFLDGLPLPIDGWTHALEYAAAADGASYRLWSIGADGVDGDGAGDDILVAK